MSNPKINPEDINTLLPQTQCGLCGFKGCKPYAEALAHQEASIDLCPPGGIPGLMALSTLLQQDPTPFIDAMQKKAKPSTQAFIREAECIGCTKCIQACPVDAILGSGKVMHTVIASECTGCELCVAPCPVDCIEMIDVPSLENRRDQFRHRYEARNHRLQKEKQKKSIPSFTPHNEKKDYIAAALLRVKSKKI